MQLRKKATRLARALLRVDALPYDGITSAVFASKEFVKLNGGVWNDPDDEVANEVFLQFADGKCSDAEFEDWMADLIDLP